MDGWLLALALLPPAGWMTETWRSLPRSPPTNGMSADGEEGADAGNPPECTPAPRDCGSPFDNDCDGSPDDTLDDACR
jgi:hypothetical protein